VRGFDVGDKVNGSGGEEVLGNEWHYSRDVSSIFGSIGIAEDISVGVMGLKGGGEGIKPSCREDLCRAWMCGAVARLPLMVRWIVTRFLTTVVGGFGCRDLKRSIIGLVLAAGTLTTVLEGMMQ
jgi:hypothetical protein